MTAFVRTLMGLLFFAAMSSVVSAASQAPQLVVQHARLSWPGEGAHFFWQIAASPTNPRHVVACSLREMASTSHTIEALIYGSTDAGETWRVLKTTSEFPMNSEVSCAMSGDDVIYFTMSVASELPDPYRRKASVMYLWRSSDFGATWRLGPHVPYSDAALLLVKKNAAGRDRVFDFADANGSSEDRYLTIFDNDATVIRKIHSWNPVPAGPDDPLHCGVKPAESRQLFDTAALPARPGGCINGATIMHPVDMGNGLLGGLYVDWKIQQPSPVYLSFTRLTDDGKPLGTPSVVLRFPPSSTLQMRRIGGVFSGYTQPSLAFGRVPGSTRHRLYVVGQNIVSGRLRVFLVTSDDTGLTWTKPRYIDDSALRRQKNQDPLPATASVAVNKDGILAVSWSEFSGRCWRIAFSRDGGAHVSSSVPINPCDRSTLSVSQALSGHVYAQTKSGLSFRLPVSQQVGFTVHDFRRNFEFLLRGTSLAAAADGSFYALWSELGSQNDELHVSHITFAGHDSAVTVQRKRIIANAVCCITPSGRLSLDYTSYDYDPATHEFEIGAVLVRERGFGGKWPIVVRLKKVGSVLGPISAANADNGVQGAGAAWVFNGPGTHLPVSSARGNIRLLPPGRYEYSQPRMLRFRVDKDLTHLSWENMNKLGLKNAALVQPSIVDVDLELLSTH